MVFQLFTQSIVCFHAFFLNHTQVQVEFDGVQVCGGSILTETIILTAAHCSIAQKRYTIRAGTTFRGKGGIIIPVKEMVVHYLFDRSKHSTFDYDVALLKVTILFQNGPILDIFFRYSTKVMKKCVLKLRANLS